MIDQRRPGVAIAGHDVQNPFGQTGLAADFGKQQRGQRGVFGGFQHDRIACGQGGCHLPRQHQQGKIPRDHRAANPKRLHVWLLALQQLREAGVIVEMPRHQRHVDVTRLADRLAIVEGFQNRQQARMFLHQAGQRIKVLRAFVPRQARPFRLCAPGGAHGGVDIGNRALTDLRQYLAGCRVPAVKQRTGCHERAVDPMAELPVMPRDPGQRPGRGFRGGAIAHIVENLFNCHGLSHRVAVGGGIGAGDVVFQLALDIAQQAGGPKAEQIGVQPGLAQLILDQRQVNQRVLGL